MMKPLKMLVLLCLIAAGLSCANSRKPLSIVPLNMLNHTDTVIDRGMNVKNKADFYLVQGYVDNKNTRDYIDSFVEKNRDTGLKENSNYSVILYKESKQTNVENIMANPKVIDRYSQDNDQIYHYSWMNGKFVARYKVKKGKFVEPKSNVTVEDIPKQ
jgi:hypothetical protein